MLIKQFKLFNTNLDNDIINYICANDIMVYSKIDKIDMLSFNRYNLNEIEFRYNENNLRIPYYNNQKIISIQIDPNEIYNYISSASIKAVKKPVAYFNP